MRSLRTPGSVQDPSRASDSRSVSPTLVWLLTIFFSGVGLGFAFRKIANNIKDIIFASLSGIFLYTSLSTFIPLLEKLMTEKRRKTRVALAMLGFLSAILIIQSLFNWKKALKQDKFLKSIC